MQMNATRTEGIRAFGASGKSTAQLDINAFSKIIAKPTKPNKHDSDQQSFTFQSKATIKTATSYNVFTVG